SVDPEHTDQLTSNSRFLITKDNEATPPTGPSLDPSAWRYYAEFSQRTNSLDPKKYSLYDHIRHLLAEDPKLKPLGLTGGLDIWLFRNTQKILEWGGVPETPGKIRVQISSAANSPVSWTISIEPPMLKFIHPVNVCLSMPT